MSAYVVSKPHIDLLVAAAEHYGRLEDRFRWWSTDEDGRFSGWYELDRHAETSPRDGHVTPSVAGQMLVSENVRSVHDRYPDDDPDAGELPGPIDAYYMGPYVYSDPGRVLEPGEVFKALDCLEYQSCEHDGWEKSDAHSFCVSLRKAACRAVPGYDDAPWGFDA